MEKFKSYYLPWLLLFTLIMGFALYKNWGQLTLLGVSLGLLTICIATLVIGKILDFAQNTWTPKRRKKFFHQVPLNQLPTLGFTNNNDEYFEGIYKGYHLQITYDHSYKRTIQLAAFYSPKSKNKEEFDRITRLIKKEKHNLQLVEPGILSLEFEFIFKIPNINKLEELINNFIQVLERHHLSPISPNQLTLELNSQ